MRTSVLLLFLAINSFAFSQWSLDPADPLVICDAPNEQRGLKAVEDGSGGWFLFWRDKRNSSSDYTSIYGQHVDADGYIQWTSNGELIVDHPTSKILEMEVVMLASQQMLLLYRESPGAGDTLRAVLIEADASHVWPDPIIVAQRDSPILWFADFALQPSGSGALIAYQATLIGGGGANKIDKIRLDGTLVYGINGADVGNSAHGPMGMESDGQDGAFVHWRNSNGAGTHLGVFRLDSSCVQVWPSIVDPVAGTPGLRWAYRAVADGQGGLAITYVENSVGENIKFTRLDASGTTATTPAIKTVGAFNSGQDLPRITLHDGYFFTCWEDNRPPANNQDLYVQKLDMNGDPMWAPEGVLAVQGQTYVPYAEVVGTDSGGVIMMQLMNSIGFIGQRVRNDGSSAWATLPTLATNAKQPFYEEFELWADGVGGAAAFWYNQADNDLYAAHVDFGGNVGDHTGVVEGDGADVFTVFPNPNDGRFFLSLSSDLVGAQFSVLDAMGKTVHTVKASSTNTAIELSVLSAGMYVLRSENTEELIIERFVIE